MSGVMVERRDHVLMTGGLEPPARAFSTAFTIPLSMNGPFLTERAISLHFQLAIADCRFENPQLKRPRLFANLSISNWRLPIADLKTLNSSCRNSSCRVSSRTVPTCANRQLAIGNRQLLSSPILQDHLLRAFVAARLVTASRSEEHTSELQSQSNLVCRLLLEKKKNSCDYYAIYMRPISTY